MPERTLEEVELDIQRIEQKISNMKVELYELQWERLKILKEQQ